MLPVRVKKDTIYSFPPLNRLMMHNLCFNNIVLFTNYSMSATNTILQSAGIFSAVSRLYNAIDMFYER
jgi:hypothetical protein